MKRKGAFHSPVFFAFSLVCVWFPIAQGQSFLKPLSDEETREVKAALESMKKDPRGPYLRIRWFCRDGTVQPPSGTPCSDRGGGVQHAELSDKAKQLARLHFNVGTILQALSFEEFFDADKDHYRLKELVLEKFLFESDDGWIFRQARYYRGARQIEDEEKQGQQFLQQMLVDPSWTAKNFLLTSLLAASVPHQTAGQSSQRIRNLATSAAQLDPDFQQLRIKIHSFPSQDDLKAVESYLLKKDLSENLKVNLEALRDELRQQYDADRVVRVIQGYQRQLGPVFEKDLSALQASLRKKQVQTSFSQIASLSVKLREQVTTGSNGTENLARMDLLQLLLEKGLVLAQQLMLENDRLRSRAERLRSLSDYFNLAFGAGLLSPRERDALQAEISSLLGRSALAALDYKQSVGYLGRGLDWGRVSARELFDPVYSRYTQVESQAVGFLDSLVRSSILLPLSRELDRLSQDADNVLGRSHFILGHKVSQGLRGLNPGVTIKVLEVVDQYHPDWHPDPSKVYVIPETIPELRPVAGILTLDAGNLLSHAQLLARNLGIPNASISSSLLPQLKAVEGKEVFYAVSPLGLVLLKEPAHLTPAERGLADSGLQAKTAKVKIDTSRVRLDQTAPIALAHLRSSDSGVVVGPKAANLGQLAALFPGRVSPGVALPFGLYYRHVNRRFETDRTVLEEIREAYRRADEMRRAGNAEARIDAFMFKELARFRRAIVELDWVADTRQAVVRALQATLGSDLNRGVFVRSDTNVEDLPQFSGAGLNLTVPHLRRLEDILQAIKRVWASPFSERAYLWRKEVLEEQGEVYPSVLLVESVPSDKSGVLITSGLEMGGPGDLTIVTAEGVGGVVEGESSETIRVDEREGVQLLSQAKSRYQKVLVNSGAGGIQLIPSSKSDVLLTKDDIDELQQVVTQWKQRIPDVDRFQVWDIEFGFSEGKLWLFQIRPFVRHRNGRMLERLEALDTQVMERSGRTISLGELI